MGCLACGRMSAAARLLRRSPWWPGPRPAPALGSNKAVHATTAWSISAARPGGQVVLAVILDIQKHYHINPDEPQLVPTLRHKFLIPTDLTAVVCARTA